jgi:KDO2-lipid IV(A) lauroyltransferase
MLAWLNGKLSAAGRNVTTNDYQRRHRPTVQHRIEYAGWRLLTALLRWLPRRALVHVADALGWLLYSVLRVRRDVVDDNLRRAFGTEKSPAELRRLGLSSYQNAVLTFCEFIQPACAGGKALSLFRELKGVDEAAEFKTRPAVFLTGHIGNWEQLGAAVQALGFPVDAILKPLHNPLIDRDVARRRREAGFGLIPTTGSLKAIVTSIRSGRHPVFLADQDARRSGVFVDFFGHPASTATGPAYFALKLGVPIVAGFCVRNHDPSRTLTLLVQPPLVPDPTAPFDDEVLRLTQAHTKMLEDVVRQYPDSYFWLHRRWKTRPKRSVPDEKAGAAAAQAGPAPAAAPSA